MSNETLGKIDRAIEVVADRISNECIANDFYADTVKALAELIKARADTD